MGGPQTPEYELRGALASGVGGRLLLLCVAASFVLAVLLLQTFAAGMAPAALLIASVLVGILFLVFVWALCAGRARLQIHRDRVVFDYRPTGEHGRRFELDFHELNSVSLTGAKLMFRVRRGPLVVFVGNRLHVEDAFDVLAAKLDEEYPDCTVLRRRVR